jgi:hypothetical protein
MDPADAAPLRLRPAGLPTRRHRSGRSLPYHRLFSRAPGTRHQPTRSLTARDLRRNRATSPRLYPDMVGLPRAGARGEGHKFVDSQTPETGPQFSRRTVLAAIDLLGSRHTHSGLTRYLQGLGQEVEAAVRPEPASKVTRLTDLIRFVDHAPPWFKVEGKSLGQTLVENAISLLPPPAKRPAWLTPKQVEEEIKAEAQTPEGAFRRALQLDVS